MHISLNFSEKCNLACEYCYVSHSKQSNIKNEQIVKNLNSLEWLYDLKNVFGEDIEGFGLWGAEPTFNLPYLIPLLPVIKKVFPKVTYLEFSTNFQSEESLYNILNILDFIKKEELNIVLKMQVSIDGPAEINDKTRIGSDFYKILEHIKILIDTCEKEKYILNNFHTRSTYNSEGNKFILDDFENNDGKKMLHMINLFKNLGLSYNYAVMIPGEYTQSDGIIYSKIVKQFDKFKLLRSHELNNMLNKLIVSGSYIRTSPHVFSKMANYFGCNIGRSSFSYDLLNKSIHYCHHSFHYNDDNKIKDSVEYSNETGMIRDRNLLNNFALSESERNDEFFKIAKKRHYYKLYQYNLIENFILILAKNGLLSERYINDKHLRQTYSLFHMLVRLCPLSNNFSSGISQLPTESLIKLYGNGAFEYLYDKRYSKK